MTDIDAEWDAIFFKARQRLARLMAPRCEECNVLLAEGEVLICKRCEARDEADMAMEVTP